DTRPPRIGRNRRMKERSEIGVYGQELIRQLSMFTTKGVRKRAPFVYQASVPGIYKLGAHNSPNWNY
ncbi:MAG: hypothetical protein OXG90_09075, partial [Gammaproteobacteria bacterium]|nr:hypothetical protein [Gammaproteobacteria bacterium]